MGGLVLVAHSHTLATAVKGLVISMSGSELPIAIAAGTGPERAELGTDATEININLTEASGVEGLKAVVDELPEIGAALRPVIPDGLATQVV